MRVTNKHTETLLIRFNTHGGLSQSDENKYMWIQCKAGVMWQFRIRAGNEQEQGINFPSILFTPPMFWLRKSTICIIMVITLSRRAAICRSVAEVQLTSVALLGAVSNILLLLLLLSSSSSSHYPVVLLSASQMQKSSWPLWLPWEL